MTEFSGVNTLSAKNLANRYKYYVFFLIIIINVRSLDKVNCHVPFWKLELITPSQIWYLRSYVYIHAYREDGGEHSPPKSPYSPPRIHNPQGRNLDTP